MAQTTHTVTLNNLDDNQLHFLHGMFFGISNGQDKQTRELGEGIFKQVDAVVRATYPPAEFDRIMDEMKKQIGKK